MLTYKVLRQHESTIGDLPMASQNMAIRRRNRLNRGHVSRLGTGSTKACESCLRGTVCMCRSTNISVGSGFFVRSGCQQFIQTGFLRFSDSTQVLCQRNSCIEKWESSLGWNLAIQHTWESCVLRYAPYAHPCNASWTGTHPSVCVDNKLKCWRPTWREAVDSFKFSTIHHPLCSCSWCKGHNKSRNNGHSRESFKLLFKILGNLSISWRDTVHSKLSLDTVNFLSG